MTCHLCGNSAVGAVCRPDLAERAGWNVFAPSDQSGREEGLGNVVFSWVDHLWKRISFGL